MPVSVAASGGRRLLFRCGGLAASRRLLHVPLDLRRVRPSWTATTTHASSTASASVQSSAALATCRSFSSNSSGNNINVSHGTNDSNTDNPVVIVGGGPTGLLLSSLLSTYGVPSTLLESKPRPSLSSSSTSGHPQAHYLNTRTMEILKHYTPALYEDVVAAMPARSQWEGFGFAHSVLGRQLARVSHPVSGLEVGMEGDGSLMPEGIDNNNIENGNVGSKSGDGGGRQRISPCDPGHLAQNRFTALLLQYAESTAKLIPGAEILHDISVAQVLDHGHDGMRTKSLEVQTECGKVYNPSIVIAADGASSPIRHQHHIAMIGQPILQHLVSIHFRTSPNLSRRLAKDSSKVNMLHFVFNEGVVGCFVCHDCDAGEWVLQVPYFDPFQTAEQFDEKRASELVLAGLGLKSRNHNGDYGNVDAGQEEQVDIMSVRPWTMSSTVAESYVIGPSKRIVLAGDAAHAFPPAGGFGMNTGLQDAHTLAWRLAMQLRVREGFGSAKKDNDCADASLAESLRQYQFDRRPIASQNAALSVRNYHRTLEVAKACYLNAEHPALLVKAMLIPPLSLLPMSVRKNMFDAAVKTATLPLRGLAGVGNPYGERIKRNIRDRLGRGQGLPLVFPRYEVGFGYGSDCGLDEGDDTAGFHPAIEVGRRLPHVELELLSLRGRENVNEMHPSVISLTDIGSQLCFLRKDGVRAPRFTAIIMGLSSKKEVEGAVGEAIQMTASELSDDNIDTNIVIVAPDREVANVLSGQVPCDAMLLTPSSSDLKYNGAIFVRPDGHVLRISTL